MTKGELKEYIENNGIERAVVKVWPDDVEEVVTKVLLEIAKAAYETYDLAAARLSEYLHYE